MNKKIALSAMSILTSLALLGGATFALFSDVGTSTDNTFGAGTLNLLLDNNGVDFFDDVSATFDVDDMFPGQSVAQEISFHNAGSINIAEIAMRLDCVGTDDAGLPLDGSNFCDVLNLKIHEGGTASGGECGAGTDITAAIDAQVSGSGLPLTMSEFNGDTYDSLAIPLAPATGDKVCIQVTMDSGAGDIYQGDSADVDFTFTAHQDASQ